MRKQLGAGVLCGPCSFRSAIPVPIELVPAKLPLSVVTKESSPQGQPVLGAGGHLPNSLLHFIPHIVIPLPSWYTHVSLGMNSVGEPFLFTIQRLSEHYEHFLKMKYFPHEVWGLVECCIDHLYGCRSTCCIEFYDGTVIVASQREQGARLESPGMCWDGHQVCRKSCGAT